MSRDYLATREAIVIACEAVLLRASRKLNYRDENEGFALNSALRDMIWKYSEETPLGRGKLGCPFWSKLALQQYEIDGETNLTLEHVFPRRNVFLSLVKAQDREQIRRILDQIETCVITDVEHALLEPRTFDPGDAPGGWWLRYKLHAGPIRIEKGPRFGFATGESAKGLQTRLREIQSLQSR